MRREGVTEQVRMNSFRLEPGLGCQLAEDQEGAGARQAAALRVQEELGSMPHLQERASPSQVTPHCLRGLAADRNDPLLRALADAPDDACVEVDARLRQPDGVALPEASLVEGLDDRSV